MSKTTIELIYKLDLRIKFEEEEFGYRASTNVKDHYFSAFGETPREALKRLADRIDFPLKQPIIVFDNSTIKSDSGRKA